MIRPGVAVLASGLATLAGCAPDHPPVSHADMMGGPRLPGACEAPAGGASGRIGCYFNAALDLGRVAGLLYWHIDEFPDARSADSARGRTGIVVAAYDRVFLYTVSSSASWRPSGGRRLATVGPMAAPEGEAATARFMEATTEPGAMTRPHRHDGAEGFYILSGAICLETPSRIDVARENGTLSVEGGRPMQLSHAGPGLRRSIFVVLHRRSRPWMTAAPDFVPEGRCAAAS